MSQIELNKIEKNNKDIEDGMLVEHWDVIQTKLPRSSQRAAFP
jgi:predicted SnoaL-like aldol condensation-catalyzing enzyme